MTLAIAGLGRMALSLRKLTARLEAPRVVLMCPPHPEVVDENLEQLAPGLERGDVVADCDNYFRADSRRRHDELADEGVCFLEIGTSCGVSDAPGLSGVAFVTCGPQAGLDVAAPLQKDLAVDEKGVFHAGPSSSVDYVKLMDNAIEFGMVQALTECVEMQKGFDHELDLPALFEHWNHGSVIRRWLLELTGHGLASGGIGAENDLRPGAEDTPAYVKDSDQVKWVVHWAMEHDIPTPVTGMSQHMLMAHGDLDWPAAKSVALLRNQYGGHVIHRTGDEERRR
jgi:6-phosphogluconate dehydrogenase